MLRFFSKKRYQFAARNKVAKYLRYAIGESIIVLIGVLLAFVLNSWWTKAKESHMQKVILSNLWDEMLYNQQELEQTIKIDEFELRNIIDFEKLLQTAGPGINIVVPDTTLSAFIIAATNNPSTGSLNSILTSGKLDYINNNDLITSIITWNNKLDDASEDEKTAFDFIENEFLPALRDQFDLTEILNNSGAMVKYARTGLKTSLSQEFISRTTNLDNSKQLKNLVAQRKMRLRIVVGALHRLSEHQSEMLVLIEKNKENPQS